MLLDFKQKLEEDFLSSSGLVLSRSDPCLFKFTDQTRLGVNKVKPKVWFKYSLKIDY